MAIMGKTSSRSDVVPVVSFVRVIRSLFGRHKTMLVILFIGFLGGFLWLTGIRFFLAQPKETHYHANFAVYINGQREEFKDFTYYEEVAACTSAYVNNPKGRVHMHDAKNDVIHVHDTRVTYGNFFENIGWALGEDFIATRERVYQNDQTNQVTYILNGERVDSIAPRVIGNLDRLLISYGPASADTNGQFASVARTAEEVNKYQDPASCGGLGGAGHNSFGSKLKRATFWP